MILHFYQEQLLMLAVSHKFLPEQESDSCIQLYQ
jgi:hypothetical protein